MDPFTLAGIVIAFVAVFASMIMEGGNPMSIFLIPPMMLVFFGTFGVAMACGLKRDTISGLKSVKDALLTKQHSPEEVVKSIVGFAELARRDGLLALEEAAKTIDDPFLKKGIELAVDGTDPEELREIMEAQIKSRKVQDKAGAKFFADMGGFAPTLGIIGTVLGLVHVLENLSDPSKLGHLIAGAFVATLWGVLTANLMWLPIGNKLARVGAVTAHHMELIVEGVLSVQAGANPRIVEQKLLSFLNDDERPEESAKAA
jgi:chemotaxis protein MotA